MFSGKQKWKLPDTSKQYNCGYGAPTDIINLAADGIYILFFDEVTTIIEKETILLLFWWCFNFSMRLLQVLINQIIIKLISKNKSFFFITDYTSYIIFKEYDDRHVSFR